ncbi:MAG: TauD/TfdA family dioxygenase [Burkholderiales bacterium]|nr:TauD/TfdA family dioxygenase [Burkholderiales bacterium]
MQATAAPGRTAALPAFRDESAWYGPDMAARGDWRLELSHAERAELDAAVDAALARGVDLVTMTERDFPLPMLGARLARVRRDLLHGRGFALLRGWPGGARSIEQSAMAFRGIGAHLGEAVSQNAKGHVLGHVANLGLDYADPTTRGYQTTAELRFHTDGGDIVGLLCVRPSKAGGLSRIASSTTLWNELVHRRPDLARVLAEPFHFSRAGEVRPGQRRFFTSPIFQPWQGRMITVLIQSFIHKAQAFAEVPRLTAAQKEALEVVEALAGDASIRLDMDFRPGDMQFLCNHSIVHSRTSYEDWPEVERRRHLLRLWLSSADGPALPPAMTTDFQGCTASGRPDGIRIPGVPLVAPLEPA